VEDVEVQVIDNIPTLDLKDKPNEEEDKVSAEENAAGQ
jgi:hypothetical protein